MKHQIIATAVILTSALAVSPVNAQSVPSNAGIRDFHQNSGGICHAASPSGEAFMDRTETGYLNVQTNARRRSQDVLVACAPVADSFAPHYPANKIQQTIFEIQFAARNTLGMGSPSTLTCTLYSNYVDSPEYKAETRSVQLPSDGTVKAILWNDNFTYANYYAPPLSILCDVPAGVELNDTIILYDNP